MIRLIVVEDDPCFRAAVREAVAIVTDIELLAEAATLAEGLALLDQPAADVLLVDLGLPDGSGIDLIRAARQRWPGCASMVATLFGDEQRVFASLEAGASGYLLKDALASGIVAEIRSLHAGGSPISPLIARSLLRRFQSPVTEPIVVPEPEPVTRLSARERQVLEFITRGYSMGEIAGTLQVSPWTVQTYVRRVYDKLDVHTQAAAVSAAQRLKLISPGTLQ